jgi:DNA-binding CsgD family transcriptional regulator
MLLTWDGELVEARGELHALRHDALHAGDEQALPFILNWLCRVEWRAGRWDLAADLGDEAYEACLSSGQVMERAYVLATKAVIDAHRGRVDAARAAGGEGLGLAVEAGVVPAQLEHHAGQGFLELSLGRFEEAHRLLGPLPAAATAAGFRVPAVFRFHGDAVETLLALGRVSDAEALLAELLDGRAALGHPWKDAISARCRGLLAAGRGDFDGAGSALGEALEAHQRLGEPFELGRTLLALGSIQRRAKKKAASRGTLHDALTLFERLGADLWAERARGEFARSGGRLAGTDQLTPTERRVANLVAEGRANKEVAAELFVSVKAVEASLSSVYSKLGIRSRTELARRFAENLEHDDVGAS